MWMFFIFLFYLNWSTAPPGDDVKNHLFSKTVKMRRGVKQKYMLQMLISWLFYFSVYVNVFSAAKMYGFKRLLVEVAELYCQGWKTWCHSIPVPPPQPLQSLSALSWFLTFYLLISNIVESNSFSDIFLGCSRVTESRHCSRQDVASWTLLLCSVWILFWTRRWSPKQNVNCRLWVCVLSLFVSVDLQDSMRRTGRRTAGKTTLTCLPPSVAAAPVPSWRTTSLLSTRCGIPSASSAGWGSASVIPDSSVNPSSWTVRPLSVFFQECFTPFINGSFFDHDGQPYCESHYHERRGSLCSGCQKPITGRCITAMGKKFHPEHFACAFCLKQLNKGTFKEQNEKPYCQSCFVKLFS